MKVNSYERMVSVEETIEKNHTADGRGLGGCDFSQKLLDTVHDFIGLFFFSVKICDPDLYTSFLELGQNEIKGGLYITFV